MSAFPPHKSVPSVPISQDVALKYLSAYLTAAKTAPHLLPNARLEPSGPTTGSSNSSVIIHNLQRVESGLKGEWLAPVMDLEEEIIKVTGGLDDGTSKEGGQADEGWMDLEQYQREQSIDNGGNDGDISGVADRGVDSDMEEAGDVVGADEANETASQAKANHNDASKQSSSKSIDKEARKREKKLRAKAMKMQIEHERQKEATA